MNNLQIFENAEFGKVRTVLINNEPWFVGKDVAEILKYRETANMRKLIDDTDYMEINPQSTKLTGFVQNGITLEPNLNIKRMLLINESGLYQAIFNSTLPAAKQFKRWITHDVIPSIRKTGNYVAKYQIPQTYAAALQLAADQAKQIEADKPKVLFANSVSSSHTNILIGELAKLIKQNGYNIGQNRLFKWLRNNGYLVNRQGNDYNMPTQKSMELGLFSIKESTSVLPDGHTVINKTTKVTGKGQIYFVHKFLGERAIDEYSE